MHVSSLLRVTTCRAFLAALSTCPALAAAHPTVEVEGEEWPLAGINGGWQDFQSFSSSFPTQNAIKIGTSWSGDFEAVDEHGYPVGLPEDGTAEMRVFENAQGSYPLGDYTLAWDGEANIEIRTAGRSIVFPPGTASPQTVAIDEPSDYGISIILSQVPKDDHLRNLRLYLPGYDGSTGIFTDHFIEDVKNFGLFRMMWGSGTWSHFPVKEWDERRQIEDHNWLAGDQEIGVPYEAMIELANRAGVDLWVGIPHPVSDDFARQFAELFANELDPELDFYPEYSNEHWLGGVETADWFFPHNQYFVDMIEDNADDPAYIGMTVSRLYARRAYQVYSVIEEVFAEAGQAARLHCVLSGGSGEARYLEEAADEMAHIGGMDLIDVMSVGPYFHQGYDDNPRTLAFEEAVEEMDWDRIMQLVKEAAIGKFDPDTPEGAQMHANAAVAVKYDKAFVAYEAGQHYTTWTNTPSEIIAPLNRRPEMEEIYEAYLNAWETIPNAATIVIYQLTSLYNAEEAFGIRERWDQPLDELPKYRGVLDWIESHEDEE